MTILAVIFIFLQHLDITITCPNPPTPYDCGMSCLDEPRQVPQRAFPVKHVLCLVLELLGVSLLLRCCMASSLVNLQKPF